MFDELNKEKSKYEKQMVLGFVFVGVAFIFYLPLAVALGPIAFFLIAIPFLGGGFYAGKYQKKIKELSNRFKSEYVVKEMKKIFPDSTYQYNRGFSEAEVVESRLLFHQDRYRSEDLITGKFDGVSFKCSDVEQKDVRRSGKHTTVVTVFAGRFYEFDFPKPFMYNLLLLQPYSFRPFSGMQKIKTESIQFNSELKVYAENDHEAFYILTPQLMERLLYMDSKYNDKITFSFLDNKLFIAIDSRTDSFDIKAFKNIDSSIFKEYQEQLNDIKEFIKVLQLDTKLFKH